jgi:nicotinamide-nucleotide amidase
MQAEIISVGNELLIGQVINTNQAFIAQQLQTVGIEIHRMVTVGDDEKSILTALDEALNRADVVTVTGGLGPTHDDVTRSAICKFFKTDLVLDEEALHRIRTFFERRGLPMIKLNEEQALVPRGCTVIQNSRGTAPGYFFERDGKYVVVMPGVPFEMEGMMKEFVLPSFRRRTTGKVILHRTLKTTGIGESFLAQEIGDVQTLFSPMEGISLAFLPSPMGVRLRITAYGSHEEEVKQKIARVETQLRAKVEKYIYATDDEELEAIVGKLLAERKLTIAVAESCTGGLIADRITNVPGSSAYFERGMIVYSNESKIAELGVPIALMTTHGAVSREVAETMAFGIRTKANVDIGLSTTGIAGPTGGTSEKPVGLVWIGYSDRHETLALKFNFGDDRRRTKERAAQAALELVRRRVLKMYES